MNDDYFIIKAPDGHLIHTTVGISEEDSIKEFLEIERAMNLIVNIGRKSRGERKLGMSSWEGYEAGGYSVVKISLVEEK